MRLKRSLLCRKTYDDGIFPVEHLCMLERDHDGPCDGHETSRDLVPPEAERVIIPFTTTAFVWPSEQIPDVYLAYAPPPLDLLTQGKPGHGPESALLRLKRTIAADRLIEKDCVSNGRCVARLLQAR